MMIRRLLCCVALAASLTSLPALDAQAAPRPKVSKLSLKSGSVNGGAVVTITGKNFTKKAKVYFGSAKAKKVVYQSKKTLVATAPKHAAGAVWVYVKTSQKSAKAKAAKFSYLTDFKGSGGAGVQVRIAAGSSLTAIGAKLVKAQVVATEAAWAKAVAAEPRATSVQAGLWQLRERLPAKKALAMLLDVKNKAVVKLTLPEGGYLADYLTLMASASGLSAAKLKAALAKPGDLGLPAWRQGSSVEGFAFPDTYYLPEAPTAGGVIRLATSQFAAVAKEVGLESGAASQQCGASACTPYQVLTVASIIEREVSRAEYRPLVARVVYNRLAQGMPLQMDSTNAYGQRMGLSGYSTYQSAGLPPTPISNPGRAALKAALAPAAGDWLYFVTVNPETGETEFNTTLEGHNASVAKYQAWCQASPAHQAVCDQLG
ncbi:MAG: endolytic transglycosylase MltG [Propionibacteriaceae bacterium]|nr:endolytic transglycosylase MltG [Propionibacteriaceae bacterium]